jgi:hypothetical protein
MWKHSNGDARQQLSFISSRNRSSAVADNVIRKKVVTIAAYKCALLQCQRQSG